MRISTIATPLTETPQLFDLQLGKSSYKALALQCELSEADKKNPEVAPIRVLYLCLPSSRHQRALEKYVVDFQNPDNPKLGLKLNCLAEGLDQWRFNEYTGPQPDDPDPTATESWFRTLKDKFTLPGSDEELFDFILMNGELDVLPVDSWGKRTLLTSDNNELVQTDANGKKITLMKYSQYSLINKKQVRNSLIVFPQAQLVKDTVSHLPDWSIVSIEGRLQKNPSKGTGVALLADSIVPIKIGGNTESVGAADSNDASVRTAAYSKQANYSSTEDY